MTQQYVKDSFQFKGEKILSIHCGGEFSSILTSNGIYSVGKNDDGELGIGDKKNNRYFFEKVWIPKDVKIFQVSCGYHHQMFRSNIGHVYSCGFNNYGQLGLGDVKRRDTPTLVPFSKINPMKSIFLSQCCSYFLDFDGIVYSCGDNQWGMLGLGNRRNEDLPTKIPPEYFGNEKIVDIRVSCGSIHVFFKTESARWFCCGDNEYQELGIHDETINILKPRLFTFYPNDDLKENEISEITLGATHTFVLTKIGRVYGFGRTTFNRMGIRTRKEFLKKHTLLESLRNEKIVKVFAETYCSFFVNNFGDMWVVGKNQNFQLIPKKKIKDQESKFSDLDILEGEDIEIPQISPVKNVVRVCAGVEHVIYLTRSGELFFGGSNYNGQLGFGENIKTMSVRMVYKFQKDYIRKFLFRCVCEAKVVNVIIKTTES